MGPLDSSETQNSEYAAASNVYTSLYNDICTTMNHLGDPNNGSPKCRVYMKPTVFTNYPSPEALNGNVRFIRVSKI